MSDSVTARWERKKLGEIGEFLNGINKSKNDFGFGVPFVNLMDVFGRTLLDKEPAGLVNASLPEVERYSVKEGDVLFVRSSVKPEGVGLTTVVDRDIPDTVYSGFIIRFRQNALIKAYARYCFHAESFRKSLLAKSTVSANTNVNQVVLSGLEIDIPSVREQQKIATILTTVDQLIEKTQTLIDKYITIKQGMMADLFTRGIDLTPGPDGRPESNPNYGQLRPPREQAPDLYKETELGWVPKEWGVDCLENLLADIPSAMRSGPFGSALLKHELVEKGIPLLGIDNIYVEKYSSKYRRFVTDDKFRELSRYAVRPNDVV